MDTFVLDFMLNFKSLLDYTNLFSRIMRKMIKVTKIFLITEKIK